MSFTPAFEISTETGTRDATLVVRARGELDSGSCAALEAECRRALADPEAGELSLDLTGVSFIDSAGMRTIVLIEQAARERDVPLVVLPPPEAVTSLLRTAGVADRITLRERPQAAIRRTEFIERVELRLPREPMSPSRARAEVRELLAGHPDQAAVGNVVLLTSELVTNAVVHPRSAGDTPIGLRLAVYEDGVRVEVDDAGEGFDQASRTGAPGDGGRGLFLVDRCAAVWGAGRIETDAGPRFRVWFELDWSRQAVLAASA